MHHQSFFSVVCPEIWEMKICVFSCVLIFILFDYFFNSWYKTRLWICFFIITHQVLQGHFLTNYTFSPALCSPRRPFGVWSLVFLFLFYSTVFCVTVSSPSFFFSKKKKIAKPIYLLIVGETFSSHLSSMSQRFPRPTKQTCQEVPALGWSLGFVLGKPGSCCFQVRWGFPLQKHVCSAWVCLPVRDRSVVLFSDFWKWYLSSPH